MSTLLMIDDNPMEHLIMQKLLGKIGLFPNASYSMDGRKSMDFLTLQHATPDQLPDVMFLDLSMPDYNGWEFLKDFAYLYPSITKPIDVYVISSSIDPKDYLLPQRYPFVKACLRKPVMIAALLELKQLYQPAA